METEVMNQEEKAVVVRPKVNEALIGIEEDKASQLRKVFIPLLDVLDGFESDYNKILKLEINDDTCKLAKRCRLDMGKVRIQAGKIKKEQKAEYIRAGKAVDGLFHIVEYAVVSKEEKLKEIETHHERIEADRKEVLSVARIEELNKYDCDGSALGLGEMNDTVWSNFLAGTKLNYETVKATEIKAEEDRIERERKSKLNNDRRLQCSRLTDFIPDFATRDLSDLSMDDYKVLTTEAIKKRTARDEEQEKIRLENDKLKKEADEREVKLKKDREDQAAKQKIKDDKIEAERVRVEKENQDRLNEEKRVSNEKLEKEKKSKAKLQKKIDDDKALQDKIKKEEIKRAADAELAPDKEKLRLLLLSFEPLRGTLTHEIAKNAVQTAYDGITRAIKLMDNDKRNFKREKKTGIRSSICDVCSKEIPAGTPFIYETWEGDESLCMTKRYHKECEGK